MFSWAYVGMSMFVLCRHVLYTNYKQGWQFSGAKSTNWDIGVHTGLIVKCPETIQGERAVSKVKTALIFLSYSLNLVT